MGVIIHPKDFLDLLHCPCSVHARFDLIEHGVICQKCKKIYPIKESILELVDISSLDNETKRELKGNTHELSNEYINRMANKDSWSEYFSHAEEIKFNYLVKYLKNIECDQIFSLGSGTGYEMKILSKMKIFNIVFCSDLSYTALYVVPHTLKNTDIKIGLFTSNLDSCPILTKDIPIVIYEALHHTPDMHKTIEKLLIEGYKHILFVEPTNNLIIKWLAKLNLAQRIEYSGLKPGRLEIKKVFKLCKLYEYESRIITLWECPEDYFKKINISSKHFQNYFLFFIDLLSTLTKPFKLGNMSIVHLRKV